jgi:hypothetical protein
MSLDYEKLTNYLKEQAVVDTGRGIGRLGVVAAKAKVAEGDLRAIVEGRISMPMDVAISLNNMLERGDG